MKVVDEMAALVHPLESTYFLDGNHRTMCKFTDQYQTGYIQVRRAIRDIIQDGVALQGATRRLSRH